MLVKCLSNSELGPQLNSELMFSQNPQLFDLKPSQNRAQKLLNYLGNVLVNGPQTPIVTSVPSAKIEIEAPAIPSGNFILKLYFEVYRIRDLGKLLHN